MVRLDQHHFPRKGGPEPGWPKVCFRTTTGGSPCVTVMVALVKLRSVICAVQLLFGHPACAGVGCWGGLVVTLNERLPFLISLAGNDWVPVTVTAPGFCPGAWLPPWFVQVVVGSALAERVMSTSPFPRPASSPEAVSVRPLSVNVGLPFL